MNWLLVGIMLLIVGVVFIAKGNKQEEAQGNSTLVSVQTGYLLLIFGLFAVIAQYLSIGDTMFILVVLTGTIVLFNRLWLRKRRTQEQFEPGWVEFSRGFFPVLLFVFLLRGFLVEPYQIPSSSMRPGLKPGDFILVNKFTYGLRLPFSNQVIVPINTPKHGDVLIFKYPNDTSVNYIKRVIGLPGDTVTYRDKKLTVNKKALSTENLHTPYPYTGDDSRFTEPALYQETFGDKTYRVLAEETYPSLFLENVQEFPYRDQCQYDEEGFSCVVPKGHYFVMGDNRDHSGDSRYWGFVPDQYIVGKGLLVWLNFGELSRIGHMIQ